jgi:phage shock protein PspC (stress-responsive transcriptional regulator)
MISLPGWSIYWDLPVLIIVVSLVYSATRYDDWGAILREAFRWGVRMTTFLGGIGVALYFIAWWMDSGMGWWVLAITGTGALIIVMIVYALVSQPETSPR